MALTISLTAELRDENATARALRREHKVPGVLYGPGYETRSLQFEAIALVRVIRAAGTSRLVNLAIADVDASEVVLVREVQRDPLSREMLHVDLYRTKADETIRLSVPLTQVGEAPAIQDVGYISTLLDEIEIECFPRDVPDAITVDLSALADMDSVITVADLEIAEGITVLTDLDADVVRPALPTMEVEEEVEVAEEAEEGVGLAEEGAEGEAEEAAPAESEGA